MSTLRTSRILKTIPRAFKHNFAIFNNYNYYAVFMVIISYIILFSLCLSFMTVATFFGCNFLFLHWRWQPKALTWILQAMMDRKCSTATSAQNFLRQNKLPSSIEKECMLKHHNMVALYVNTNLKPKLTWNNICQKYTHLLHRKLAKCAKKLLEDYTAITFIGTEKKDFRAPFAGRSF